MSVEFGRVAWRTRQRRLAMASLSAWLLIGLASSACASVVEVAVTGITDARGHVRVELCTKDTFLTGGCPYQGEAPAVVGATVVKISQVPPGQYAAQAFHDETDQGVVHQNLLGIPRERIGFSNNAPLHVRGPHFDDAAFSVGREMARITLRVRHLFRAG
jgi:uncharacterized protein (DUF2141 family)